MSFKLNGLGDGDTANEHVIGAFPPFGFQQAQAPSAPHVAAS
jgi:hypothetical protein